MQGKPTHPTSPRPHTPTPQAEHTPTISGIMRQHIGEEADKRLGLYLPLSAEQQQEQQKLPERMFEIRRGRCYLRGLRIRR